MAGACYGSRARPRRGGGNGNPFCESDGMMKFLVTYEIDTSTNALLDSVTREHLEAMVANPPSKFMKFVSLKEKKAPKKKADEAKPA